MGKKQRSSGNPGIPDLSGMAGFGEVPQMDFDDADLEAELGDILGEDRPKPKPKAKGGKKAFSSIEEWANFDKMVAGCMDDIGDDDDEDIDDPDLLAELMDVAEDEEEPAPKPIKKPPAIPPRKVAAPPPPVPAQVPATPAVSSTSLLTQRMEEYKTAAISAKNRGDKESAIKLMGTFKALKQCEAQNGEGFVDPGPPSGIHVNQAPPPQNSSSTASDTAAPSSGGSLLDVLRQHRHLFFVRLQAETNASKTRRYTKQLKQFDDAIKAVEAGKNVDVSGLPVMPGAPPFPSEEQEAVAPSPSTEEATESIPEQSRPETQSEPTVAKPQQPPPQQESPQKKAAMQQPTESVSSTTLDPPKSVLEGLLQRREMMQTRVKAETGAKARRLERQTKQYDAVIKSYRGGKAVDYSSLVVPPGAPDMPGETQLTLDQRMKQADDSGDHAAPSPINSPQKMPSPAQPQQVNTSKCAKQLEFLQNRHEEFKKAAIQARDNGNRQEAMTFMKTMKSLQNMIEHTKNGLPCDISKVPAAPIPSRPAIGTIQGSQKRSPAHSNLLEDLQEQLKKAKTLSKTFTALNMLDKASMMDKWASETFRDISAVDILTKQGRPIPDVIWETRRVKSIKLFTHIEPNQCEIKVENLLEMPKDLHNESIFVQVHFPYPREPECIFRSGYVKSSANINLEFKHVVGIDRQKNAFKRAIERKPVEFEVFKKGGIFSSDRSLMKSAIKLTDFETECEIRKVLPLVANKKPVAKIQVRLRLREPMEKAQVVEEEMQWAILDSVAKKSQAKKPATRAQPTSQSAAQQGNSNLPKLKPKSALKHDIAIAKGGIEIAKQKRDQEKFQKFSQQVKLLEDELARSREYARSHPADYKVICANYIQKCMTGLEMAEEQGWTEQALDISEKIGACNAEIKSLSEGF